MAVRRPSPPRLQAGRPGAAPEPAQPQLAPLAPTPPMPTQPVSAPTAQTPPATLPVVPEAGDPRPIRRAGRRAGRRTVLLAGAAAAVVVPVTAGTLLRREDSEALSAGAARSGPGAGVQEGPLFEDVAAGTPGAEAIRWAHMTGVQPGLSPTEYAPDAQVTRGDIAVALHRLAGSPAVDLGTVPTVFTDLGEDPARVSAVLWLHGRGALWGDAQLRVHPDGPATRDCAAMMLAALMRPALAGMGVTWDASTEVSLPLPEDPSSAPTDVAWLAAAGMAPDSLAVHDWAGEEGVTRAELAVSLHRADSVIASALG